MTLEDAILVLVETGGIPTLATAVRKGRLTSCSPLLALETTFPGQPKAQQAAAAILRQWGSELPEMIAPDIARLVECGANLIARERQQHEVSRLVWTGPEAPGSFPRSSRQIVRELIAAARKEIWLVAYWIAGPRDSEGIVSDVVELLANATEKGINVAVALDGRRRANGETNFDVLRYLWPRNARLPRLYTWLEALNEPHLKLHAKALVTDRADALVTSANLTMHALEHSMELGIRVRGSLANEIATQLDCLVGSKVLSRVAI
jgi:phosphatidylserine/phosphatidylglycerophosphate/cardiolipin synthase-like enzyme